jgi:hypothetical protein
MNLPPLNQTLWALLIALLAAAAGWAVVVIASRMERVRRERHRERRTPAGTGSVAAVGSSHPFMAYGLAVLAMIRHRLIAFGQARSRPA